MFTLLSQNLSKQKYLCESCAILLLFKMSRITRTLFENIMRKKLIIFHGRGTPPWKISLFFLLFLIIPLCI